MRLMGDPIGYLNPIDCTIAKNKTRPRWFFQKGADSIRALEKWSGNNLKASPGERAAAENIVSDLRNALGH